MGGPLQLVRAEAVRENVVRLSFSDAVYFSEFLDPHDASSRRRYAITPTPGSVDDDGDPTRPIFPATIDVVGAAGSVLEVTTDRPMSSWPAKYLIAVNQLRSSNGNPLDPAFTSQTFSAVRYAEIDGAAAAVTTSGDFANPQTVSGLATGATLAQSQLLGSFPIGPDGDYATDRGLTGYKKRIIRRLISSKGGFASLPSTYGLGAMQRVKKVLRPTDATTLAADAQVQVQQDPETKSCSVTVDTQKTDPTLPVGVVVFHIQAIHVSGQSTGDLAVPMAIS